MTKQEAIRKAYKDHEYLLPYIKDDGWIDMEDLNFLAIGVELARNDLEFREGHNETWWRPKFITAIENNNGWTKISFKYDLPSPEKYMEFTWINKWGHEEHHGRSNGEDRTAFFLNFSHWRPYTPNPKPLW